MKTYNKLIRDRIPEIIEADNKTCLTRVLDQNEYIQALKDKLLEEATEARNSLNTEQLINEIADIYEVIDALTEVLQIDKTQIEAIQKNKADKNGRFKNRLFLISTDDK